VAEVSTVELAMMAEMTGAGGSVGAGEVWWCGTALVPKEEGVTDTGDTGEVEAVQEAPVIELKSAPAAQREIGVVVVVVVVFDAEMLAARCAMPARVRGPRNPVAGSPSALWKRTSAR
jgi:hypothetical protein